MQQNKLYNYLKLLIPIPVLISSIFCSCTDEDDFQMVLSSTIKIDDIGVKTESVPFEKYQKIIYVSVEADSDSKKEGSKETPYNSISIALSQIADPTPENRYAVIVAEGDYRENTIQMKEFVDLYGGFSSLDWQRDIFRFPSVLNGERERRILIGSDSTRLDGFFIRNGEIRGNGGGLLCDGTSPIITNNIFYDNKTLKPIPWAPKFWHEMANDGGAIHCMNGAAPEIRNNHFIENRTENGRGAAIACNNKCQPKISGNLFIHNVSGMEDPMRSSDGGAISIFDWCDVVLENNLLMNNEALSSNDGGAVFIALWSSATIRNNVFLNNACDDDAGALFVGGQEHRYDSPLDPLPAAETFYVSIENNIFMGNENPSRNSGAMRFTMESRGKFSGNLVVHNTGIYFQRSEVTIEQNTILDNFLFVDTKEGLKQSYIKSNLILGDYHANTPVLLENNYMKNKYMKEGNYSEYPGFIEDSQEITAFSTNFSRFPYLTEVLLGRESLKPGELSSRIVKVGDRWGLVKENDSHSLSIYGDFTGEILLKVLPSYQLKN
jgi:hypothetical protein